MRAGWLIPWMIACTTEMSTPLPTTLAPAAPVHERITLDHPDGRENHLVVAFGSDGGWSSTHAIEHSIGDQPIHLTRYAADGSRTTDCDTVAAGNAQYGQVALAAEGWTIAYSDFTTGELRLAWGPEGLRRPTQQIVLDQDDQEWPRYADIADLNGRIAAVVWTRFGRTDHEQVQVATYDVHTQSLRSHTELPMVGNGPASVATTQDGFVVGYARHVGDTREVALARFGPGGVPLGRPVMVDAEGPGGRHAGTPSRPEVATRPDRIALAWRRQLGDRTAPSAWFEVRDEEGEPWGPRIELSPGDGADRPTVQAHDGGFVVTWEANLNDGTRGIFLGRFDDDGVPQGQPQLVSAGERGPFARPDLALFDDQGFTRALVSWEAVWDDHGYGTIAELVLQ